MDSTSQRNINFSSMHIMANSGNTHQQLYLGVESTSSHTSEMQVATLKGSIQAICDISKHAPKCITSPETPLELTEVVVNSTAPTVIMLKTSLKSLSLKDNGKLNPGQTTWGTQPY